MNNTPLRKVIKLLVIFYLLSFFFLFLFSIYTYTATKLIGDFMWPYIWYHSLKLFIRYLLPVTVSSVLITYSLLFKIGDAYTKPGIARPFNQMIAAPLVLFVILTTLYMVLLEGVQPKIVNKLESEKYLSSLVREYGRRWEDALKDKNYEKAIKYLDLYLAIDKSNKKVMDKLSDIKLHALGQGKEETKIVKKAESGKVSEADSMTKVDEYIKKAEEYFKNEDYYSANYYATLAYRIDPERRDARRIAGQSWEKIASFTVSEKEKEKSSFFKMKKEGYSSLMGKEYIKAYYIFKSLQKEKPDDPDVVFYLKKAQEKISKISFFIDEAEKVLTLPGQHNLFFVNSRKNGEEEFIFIGSMIRAENGIYFTDIESIKLKKNNGVIYHFKAPYGKYVTGTIVMNCIDRENPGIRKEAVYISGSRARGEKNIIRLNPLPEELSKLRIGYGVLRDMSIAELWTFRKDFTAYGFVPQYIEINILLKLLRPFSFLILSLFAIVIGWIFRIRYADHPSVFSFIVIPLFPAVVFFFIELYQFANRIILGYTLMVFGFTIALIFLLVLETFLLILTMVFLSGQITE
ncbi:MAG: hypothetical protein GXP33_16720 [Spirochaetes bacterium]|nr:hypothetical protein [Spirochaetota bacterium]